MRVLIAGGGIGGLALALSLHERGIPCTVFEAAQEVRELGVGINILPHAVRELGALGLLPALDAAAIRTRELRYLNRFGQTVWVEQRGIHAGHDMPQLSIHRGRLHGILWRAALARLGAGALRTGRRLVAFEQCAEGVTARFADGSAERGDVLVGADGIHSALRVALHPEDGGIRWNGIQMWRGALDWPVFESGDTMIVAGDMVEKLVLYPIAPGATPGTRLTNWVICAQLGDPGRPPPRREDWSRPGPPEDIVPHLRRFRIPFLDVEALVRATPQSFEYPMCDRDPLPWWTRGRVTLLGDAAHPMYPVGSNGASQAILDARCLARCLAGMPVGAALGAYQAERLPRTAEIVRSNRAGGPERVVDVVSARAPTGFARLRDVASQEELAAIIGGYATMAGFGTGGRCPFRQPGAGCSAQLGNPTAAEEAAVIRRRELALAALGLGVTAAPSLSAAQAAGAGVWPERPIRWIVGYSAGNTSDAVARLVGGALSELLGRSVVVENRPGAGAIVATEAALRAPADGHVILTVDNTMLVCNPALYRRLPFDPDRELVPVTLHARATFFLVVRRDAPFVGFAEVQAAAGRPQLTFGTPSVASPHHLAMEVLKRHAGMQAEHVPYRSTPAVVQDLLAGRIDLAPLDVASALPLLRAGEARALLTFAEARSALQPEVPTARELGFREVVAGGWLGAGVAARTPPAIVRRLHAAMLRALASDAVASRIRELGLDLPDGDSDGFDAMVRAESAIWRPLIRELGLRLDG